MCDIPLAAVLALIENSGFGSRHAAPAVRAIYDVYFEKSPRPNEVPEEIAQIPKLFPPVEEGTEGRQ